MSFTQDTSKKFGRVFSDSRYMARDPIVKIHTSRKGQNVIFGGSHQEEVDPRQLIYIGKVMETGTSPNLLGYDAWLDIRFPHVAFISGTRGSGKSFDLGVILEGISQLANSSPIQQQVSPITSILIDTQSQFWTLRYPPSAQIEENASQLKSLETWNIEPNALAEAKVFVPPGSQKFLGDELDLLIRPKDLTSDDWRALLEIDTYGPQGHVIGQALESLKGTNYSIDQIISEVRRISSSGTVAENSCNAVIYRLQDAKNTGLFDPAGLDPIEFITPGRCSILMLRELRNEDKSLVTALIARRLFETMGNYHRQKKHEAFFNTLRENDDGARKIPDKVWLLIDEAHVVAPREGSAPARKALIEYVKRGRDAGLSLVLATQQPAAVDDRILSQVNLTFNHRLTFQNDITAAINRVPTKTVAKLKFASTEVSDFGDMLRFLEAGECFVGDHSTSRAILLKIRPRVTSHGGYSPI